MTRRSLLAAIAIPGWSRAAPMRLEDLEHLDTVAIRAELDHVQGIDVRRGRLWISSVDRDSHRGFLHQIALPSGEPVAEALVGRAERYHPGGIALDGDSIWVPVAEYSPRSTADVQRRHADSLELRASFSVADHIGCIAAGAGRLIGGNWDSELFYEWDREGGLIAKKSRRTQTHYQDLKMDGGLVVASGNLSGGQGAIDWLSPVSLTLRRRIVAGETDRGVRFTNEGMAIRDGKLYLLPEDGPSRLFIYRLPSE